MAKATPTEWADRYVRTYHEEGLDHASWIGREALDDLREDPAGQQEFSTLVDKELEGILPSAET